MAHLGSLGTQSVSGDVHDIRGTIVRGSDGVELGKVDDVLFDHDTMEIRYLVVDGAGWLEAETFLLPADLVFTDENHEDGLATGVTKSRSRTLRNISGGHRALETTGKNIFGSSRNIGKRTQSYT